MVTESSHAVPRHVAIIMDGNGRWARQHGKNRLEGHAAGAQTVRAVLNVCAEYGIHYLTLYAFSTENWTRPRDEVNGLMKLLQQFLRQYEKELHQKRIRLRAIGRLQDLPIALQRTLNKVMAATSKYQNNQLILCLSYGGRAEIVDAARALAGQVQRGTLTPNKIDETLFAQNLYAPDIPDPDFMIRTSGETRLSNFLLWQLSYAEFYFSDVFWPDFREEQFRMALAEYSRRQRRFGRSS